MPLRTIFMLALSLLLFISPLRASCGCTSCPLDSIVQEKRSPGNALIDYSYQYTDQNRAQAGTERASIGQIPGHHDETFTVTRIHTLRAAAGVTRRFSVDFSLPFVSREHQHIHRHHGNNLLETWNLSGIGDLALLTRTALTLPLDTRVPLISIILGGKFPTGKTDARGTVQETSNRIGSQVAELGLQPGTGSYDLIAGASAQSEFIVPMLSAGRGTASFFADASGNFTGKGREDYRLGNSFKAGVGVTYPLTAKFACSLQANLLYSAKDDKGATSEETDKTGGVWVYATPGVRLALAGNLSGYLHVQVPVYRNVNVIQLVSPCNLILGLTYKFSLN